MYAESKSLASAFDEAKSSVTLRQQRQSAVIGVLLTLAPWLLLPRALREPDPVGVLVLFGLIVLGSSGGVLRSKYSWVLLHDFKDFNKTIPGLMAPPGLGFALGAGNVIGDALGLPIVGTLAKEALGAAALVGRFITGTGGGVGTIISGTTFGAGAGLVSAGGWSAVGGAVVSFVVAAAFVGAAFEGGVFVGAMITSTLH